ncbi:MAG: TonB-dependent receptor [Bacteroidetes bacterium]|nr:TonB-dependent receptor [Bacteroidota bacterium]
MKTPDIPFCQYFTASTLMRLKNIYYLFTFLLLTSHFPARLLLTILLAGGSLLTSLHAQSYGILKGVVSDVSDKEPIIGAIIFSSGDKSHGVASDINGNYELHLNPGKHTVICSIIGMRSDTMVVISDSLKAAEHNFILESASTQLETMVVSAGKYERKLEEITVSMEVIKSNLIENKNSTNVKGVLEQAPGLNILDGEPQIRGGSGFNFGIGSRVAILIDGLPAMAGDGGRPEWNFIPLENVEQIEIIKGASSVTYGSSALSGSINIRTAYPKEDPVVKVSAYSGIYDAPSIDSAKWWKGSATFYGTSFLYAEKIEQTDLVIGGMDIYDHGFIGPPGYRSWSSDTTIRDSEVGEKTRRMNCNFRYRPKKIPRLNFGVNGNLMKSQNNLSLIWDNDTSGLYRAFPNTMTLQNQTIYYVEPFLNYYTEGGFKYGLRTRYFSTKNVMPDQTIETDVTYTEYQFIKQIKSLGDLNITGGIIRNQTNSKSGLAYKGILPKNHLENYGIYTQLDKKLWDFLNVSAGFRSESFKMNDEKSVWKPIFRSGLNLKLAEATFLRYSYGQGYRFPTITEKYIRSDIGGIAIYPNPILKPETSWNTEIGLKQGFKINNFVGYIDAAAFWQEYKNTIEFTFGTWGTHLEWGDTIDDNGFIYLNTGATRVRGAELSLAGEGKMAKDFKLSILAGYTYVLPQAVNPGEVFATDSNHLKPQLLSYDSSSTDSKNSVLKYRFQHIAKIDMQLGYKAFFIGGSCRYYSFVQNIDRVFYLFEPQMHSGIEKYRKANDNGTVVVDARIGMDITKKFKAAFIVNNALNKSYSLRPLKIESPRTFALRLSFDF